MPGFGEKLSKFASNTKKQAQVLVETNKLKSAVHKEEEAIKEAYSQLGQNYFDTYREDSEIPANFRQMLDGILGHMQQIEELSDQIEEVQGIKTCPQCGTETDMEKPFCSNCGYRYDEEPRTQQAAPQPVVSQQPAAAVPVEYEQVSAQTEQAEPADTQGTWPPATVTTEPEQSEEQQKVCASCGTPIEDDKKFCGNCGQKVD